MSSDPGQEQEAVDGLTGFLLGRSLASGVLLASFLAIGPGALAPWVPAAALLFLAAAVTLRAPRSARGRALLAGYGILLAAWAGLALMGRLPADPSRRILFTLSALAALLTGGDTEGLSGAGILGQRRGLANHLLVQSLLGGCGILLLAPPSAGLDALPLRWMLGILLVFHLLMTLALPELCPEGREREYRAAAARISFSRLHWVLGVGMGMFLPVLLLVQPHPGLWVLAGGLVVAALGVEGHLLVWAGRAP